MNPETAITRRAATCSRTPAGTRSLAAGLRTTEQLALEVRVRRGSRTVAQRSIAALGAGARTVRVPIGRNVRAGRATLQIVARDTSGESQGAQQAREPARASLTTDARLIL